MKKLFLAYLLIVSSSAFASSDGSRLLSIHDAMTIYHMGNIEWLRNYAKRGPAFSNADVALGVYYARKKDNIKESIKYEKIASKDNNQYADLFLGDYYYIDHGRTNEDCIEAKKYFHRGAIIGWSQMYLKMAEFYYVGCDGTKNYRKSIYWLKKIEPSANKFLARAYDKIGEKNKAEQLIDSSANSKNFYSVSELANMSPYSVGGKTFKIDLASVEQIVGRNTCLMDVDGEHFIGVFENVLPSRGEFVSGEAVGSGVFKYENALRELKTVPKLRFEKYKVLSMLNKNNMGSIAKKVKEQILDLN